jgi:hypothetical protein
MRSLPILAAGLFLAGTATTQGPATKAVYHKDSSPSVGGGNAFPWGSQGIRYQAIVDNALIGGPAVIQDILVAHPSTGRDIPYADIEIRMGLTTQAAETTDWNLNNPNPTMVYRGPLNVKFFAGAWNGIGLPNSYVYAPTNNENLCVEVIIYDVADIVGTGPSNFYFPLTAASPAVGRAFRYDWTNNPNTPLTGTSGGSKFGLVINSGNFVILGNGCTSSANTELQIGSQPNSCPTVNQKFQVDLTGGAPNSLALLVLGSNDQTWGPVPLPFDMTAIGAPGCKFYQDWLLSFPALVDGSGVGAAILGFPNDPSLVGARLFSGWLNVDAQANPAGVTTSGYAKIILGA